ncbi:MAG TPA: tripartite tricarboxylate transporter substrate-binding protein [Burkholderiales bacterium]|nr:tripartite tricarboxylate transporter substrate-binding protein [Burkholderiales bacterium]
MRYFVLVSAVAFCGAVHAQEFPTRPVRIVTSAVGGTTDLVARLIAQGLTASLGQQVIVDNRPTGIIPGEIVVKALPDGYTLLFSGSSLWMMPLLQKVPFDPVKDLAPIALGSSTPNLVVVHPSVPATTVIDLIALAKAKPGALNYGSGATGASSHLGAELFKYMAGVNIVRIPYKGQGPAVLGLLGGEVQMSFATSASVAAHVKSGKLRALAIATAKPSALAPGLPTVAESGLPGYQSASNAGMFAPVRAPVRLITLLNREIVQALNKQEVKDLLFRDGTEVVGGSPQEFAASIKTEMASLGKVIKAAGIRTE